VALKFFDAGIVLRTAWPRKPVVSNASLSTSDKGTLEIHCDNTVSGPQGLLTFAIKTSLAAGEAGAYHLSMTERLRRLRASRYPPPDVAAPPADRGRACRLRTLGLQPLCRQDHINKLEHAFPGA
jgi:hypothetical protein